MMLKFKQKTTQQLFALIYEKFKQEIHDVSLEKAKEVCQEFGSQIVSIHSKEENQFIYGKRNEKKKISHFSLNFRFLKPFH